MGFLSDLVFEKRETLEEYTQKFLSGEDFGYATTKSGVKVNEKNSVSLTAVWACVSIIARIMASMPIFVYKNLSPEGKEKANYLKVYNLLHSKPNNEQTSYQWRFLTIAHSLLWGAGVSEIVLSPSGEIDQLRPIHPSRVRPARTPSGDLFYKIRISDTQEKNYLPYQLFILPYFSLESGTWLSPIGVHRETIGAALAVKEFGANVFGKGTNPGAILSGVKFQKSETEDSMRKKYKDQYEGLGKSHSLMILEDGVKFDRVGLPLEDAQYIETRRFDVSEVARMFSVPLFLLQDHEKQTSWGAGIEEQKQGLVDFTLIPPAVQFEQEAHTKLLFDNPEYYVKFNFNSLLRGKLLERYQTYGIARQWGLKNSDECRELEDENPLPDGLGKVYINPLNMVNAKFSDTNPYTKENKNV